MSGSGKMSDNRAMMMALGFFIGLFILGVEEYIVFKGKGELFEAFMNENIALLGMLTIPQLTLPLLLAVLMGGTSGEKLGKATYEIAAHLRR